ncbi:type VII secretion-associated serine protease mycosin [Streptomyces beijiangensis]|uniref:Type VII secretion-associated serine protease mycosin n=1 Tax=Streptomyces beijiangensis TaxID=163361 RepID=A0A939F3X5_9ACTN|nr:type VII secretion-associated serine protease mycosin [Streptomyces beijiangensis]MBO0511284.1 type VII secretion-associated serine protease mycosin [Streptomyces beijiangensis]
MGVKRVWSATGVVALTGALLLTSAPIASADYIRDKQWYLDVVSAQKVWAETQGQGVKVAVVDTGVDGSQPDLTGQLVGGVNVTTASGGPDKDPVGHGTSMASLIAGHGHGPGNSSGITGLAPKAKIIPVRASLKEEGGLDVKTWAQGIRYAVDHGASVINLSFGDHNGDPGSDGAKAIAYAQEHDVVVLAATGNDGTEVSYPAALPGVVAVGAVDQSLNIWGNSNHGSGVTLTAPGVDIASVNPNVSSGYAEASGTSDATALVSATAALVRSKYPDLTAGQVINRLIKSAKPAGTASATKADEFYGYGIIRPYMALTMDIPAGPKEGPLAQAPTATKSEAAPGSGKSDAPNTKDSASSSDSSSSGSLIAIVGGIAAVVVIGIVIAVILRRRNRGGPGGPGGGTPVQGMGGYPNQPQYPANSPGQYPQGPQPYGQQAPQQGPSDGSNPYAR